MQLIDAFKKSISDEIVIRSTSTETGGCINEAFKVNTNQGPFFIKKNLKDEFPSMFEKEAKGLSLLKEANCVHIPEVLACDSIDDEAYLILEYVLPGRPLQDFWQNFGQNLAKQHRQTSGTFGLDHDNYVGTLMQKNTLKKTWAEFFVQERIEPQLKMAVDQRKINYSITAFFERFYNRIEEMFPKEPPALLHGDLWGGNFMVGESGQATIYDPSIYYGHREMDLALSCLFGGFSSEFYEFYDKEYPLDKGWKQRVDYCNLYPLLIHVNLFGGGYAQQVKSIISRF